jgi:hypothetical protein
VLVLNESPQYWKDIVKDEDKTAVLEEVVDRIALAVDKEILYPKGAPIWLNIIYLLDLFNSGTFHGKVSLRIKGNVCDNMVIEEKTNKLQEEYYKIMDKICG